MLRVNVGFPAVMATGIVSVAAAGAGRPWLSWTFFSLAAVFYVWSVIASQRSLDLESFAAVAATAVLGTRIGEAGLHTVAEVLLVAAGAGWIAVWTVVLRSRRFGSPTGTRLLCVVATQAAATLAVVASSRLDVPAFALLAFGIALYPAVVATIPPRELRVGAGDTWITMGALAVSALAAAHVAAVTHEAAVRALARILWAAATAWLPVLVLSELRWPRVGFEPRRWSTVFPLGMYSACSTAVARDAGLVPHAVGVAALWIAVLAWLATAAGAVRRAPA